MLTWWFCTLGNNHGTSRNWESSTWQPDSELHHLKGLRIGWLWHWLMSKPCVQNKWVKCVPPLDFSFSPNERTWLAWLLFLIPLDFLTLFFFFYTSLATLTTVLEPTCNHLMHCTGLGKKRKKKQGRRNSFTLPPQKFSFNCICVFCLKTGLDSFICEASQLGGIFLPTYLYAQTVSLEHESRGLRKSSHTSAERDRRACTHTQTHGRAHAHTYVITKNRSSYPTNSG